MHRKATDAILKTGETVAREWRGVDMTDRCVYCAMALDMRPIRRKLEGEVLTFCSQRCLGLFQALGPQGKVRARIQTERAGILSELEKQRGTRALTLIHRREPWSDEPGGFITIEDSEALVAQIRRTPRDRPIDLILHTPGGIALAAEMIAMAVKKHEGKVTAIVPFYAMSGGSLIALAADEILMEKESILGPVDPQIQGFPARSLITLLSRKPIETISDQMVVLSEIAQKSVDQVKEFVKWLLEDKLDNKEREAIAIFLTGGYISHDTPIVLDVAKELGLPAKEGIPAEVYDLFRTFEFGECARPHYAPY